jgi:hypothetical protein
MSSRLSPLFCSHGLHSWISKAFFSVIFRSKILWINLQLFPQWNLKLITWIVGQVSSKHKPQNVTFKVYIPRPTLCERVDEISNLQRSFSHIRSLTDILWSRTWASSMICQRTFIIHSVNREIYGCVSNDVDCSFFFSVRTKRWCRWPLSIFTRLHLEFHTSCWMIHRRNQSCVLETRDKISSQHEWRRSKIIMRIFFFFTECTSAPNSATSRAMLHVGEKRTVKCNCQSIQFSLYQWFVIWIIFHRVHFIFFRIFFIVIIAEMEKN